MKKPQEFPEEVFHLFAAMLPRFVDVAEQQCSLAPIEIYVLWYIRRFGKQNSQGEMVFLRHKLTELLGREFRYSAKNVSDLIKALHEGGLIKTGASLKREEMRALYGSDDGRSAVVTLCPEGLRKIEDFKTGSRLLFNDIVKDLPPMLRTGISRLFPLAGKFAKPMLEALQRRPPTE